MIPYFMRRVNKNGDSILKENHIAVEFNEIELFYYSKQYIMKVK